MADGNREIIDINAGIASARDSIKSMITELKSDDAQVLSQLNDFAKLLEGM